MTDKRKYVYNPENKGVWGFSDLLLEQNPQFLVLDEDDARVKSVVGAIDENAVKVAAAKEAQLRAKIEREMRGEFDAKVKDAAERMAKEAMERLAAEAAEAKVEQKPDAKHVHKK